MSSRLLSFPFARQRPSALSRLLAASRLARSRRSLHLLDDRLLADIGLTRSEALSEAGRARWDAPAHWKG